MQSVRFGCLQGSVFASLDLFWTRTPRGLNWKAAFCPTFQLRRRSCSSACCCCSDSCNLVTVIRADVSGDPDALCVGRAAAVRPHASARFYRTALTRRQTRKYGMSCSDIRHHHRSTLLSQTGGDSCDTRVLLVFARVPARVPARPHRERQTRTFERPVVTLKPRFNQPTRR